MKFDYVHDIQRAYRKLIDSISKPGTISSLDEESRKLDLAVSCNKSILVLMLMLLDTEVTFHIAGQEAENISRYISQLTYSRVAPLEEADFIYILEDVGSKELESAIKRCKIGDLVNPHLSATLIIEVEEISNHKDLVLRGPGIKEEKYISISTEARWAALRAEKNIEYPLGIEMYFVDKEHKLLALPRTTKITK
ncbi:MAG: alpha-D-ribose 1-methylphosphonate 5-triphosphate synthase subunit PhnH [Thermoanaerobacterium sp.]|jgi:alpha-D-ribose 1-methylphosphonate 5-triphosphate synthase subunit PhnH|nr:alpha-D-ribose 1-methylphosphonate 5-triphosphate synthase subunit PhnH [Thermoanaerobacterium sp.]MDK2824483.1 alpha-D-ribose 1-methylphosphonate 5-triphosphate synthase subunit PhnH [Clostridia bacterium]